MYYPSPQRPPWAPPPTSGLAVASLVCALAGFVTFGLAAIPAVMLGHLARRDTRRGRAGGDGMAVAGLIVGYLQVALFVLGLVVLAYLTVGTVDTSPPTPPAVPTTTTTAPPR